MTERLLILIQNSQIEKIWTRKLSDMGTKKKNDNNKASSYARFGFLKLKMFVFEPQNQSSTLIDPKKVIFRATFRIPGIIFRTAPSRNWRPKLASEFGFAHIVEGTSVQMSRKQQHSNTAAQAASAQYCCVPYPIAHASGITTSRWNGVVMVSTTRALPPSSQ